MATRGRMTTLVVGGVALVQVAALVAWAVRFGASVGVDFDAHLAAARLLLAGHRDTMYDLPTQVATLHAAGLAGLGGVNHAGWGPVGLLTVLPFALLPGTAAVVLWTVLQAGALAAAVGLATRGLRRPGAAALLALVSPGLAALLVLGQWEGFAALLVVLAWIDDREGRPGRSALWLVLLAGALPQLAVGLVVFQAARRGWPQVRVLAAGGIALVLGSLALLGSGGLAGWLGQVGALGREVPTQDTDGLPGLVAHLVPAGGARLVLTGMAVAAALGVCAGLARRPGLPQPSTARGGLAAATLSLLVSPHLFQYGMVVLTPLLVATILVERRGSRRIAMALLWATLGALDVAALHVADAAWLVAFPVGLLVLATYAVVPARRRVRLGHVAPSRRERTTQVA